MEITLDRLPSSYIFVGTFLEPWRNLWCLTGAGQKVAQAGHRDPRIMQACGTFLNGSLFRGHVSFRGCIYKAILGGIFRETTTRVTLLRVLTSSLQGRPPTSCK